VIISMFEKIGLLTIIINSFKKIDYKEILKFNLLIFCSTGPLYYFFNRAIFQHNFIIFICYVLTCILMALSYYNFIRNNNKRMYYCFLSILLFCFAEVFFGIYCYFDKSTLYLASGFSILGFARYIFYRFMLKTR